MSKEYTMKPVSLSLLEGIIKRSKKKILHLNLKKKWYDLIASGEKIEEIREVNNYWIKRLTDNSDRLGPLRWRHKLRFRFKEFDEVWIKCGYPKKDDWSRIMRFEFDEIVDENMIHPDTGVYSWVFKIKLGERIHMPKLVAK